MKVSMNYQLKLELEKFDRRLDGKTIESAVKDF